MQNSSLKILLIVAASLFGVNPNSFSKTIAAPKVTPNTKTTEAIKGKNAAATSAGRAAQLSSATGEEINWQVISSGGTKGTSTNYVLKGTAGQTAVGLGSSTNYGLSHGFWQEFGPTSCCNHDGIRGDVNYDLSGPNVADLTYLVDYLFRGGPIPPCIEEADINGDTAGPNVADLTYLVDYLFRGGPPPPPCP